MGENPKKGNFLSSNKKEVEKKTEIKDQLQLTLRKPLKEVIKAYLNPPEEIETVEEEPKKPKKRISLFCKTNQIEKIDKTNKQERRSNKNLVCNEEDNKTKTKKSLFRKQNIQSS